MKLPRLKALFIAAPIVGLLLWVQNAGCADKKRAEPEPVPVIEWDGVRYEAVMLGAQYGYDQDGGIIVARDMASNRLLWSRRVYSVSYDQSMEDDKQDVFITTMALSDDRQRLLGTNQRGEQFEFLLPGRITVKLLGGQQ